MGTDLRVALGHLRRHLRPALATAAALALGVGAATAVFSVVDAVLLRPLPFTEPGRLVRLQALHRESGAAEGPSPLDYGDWERHVRSLAHVAASYRRPATLRGDGPPEAIDVAKVAPAFFEVFAGSIAAGRGFETGRDTGAVVDGAGRFLAGERVAVLSHGLWQRRFGGDPGVVGREISIERVTWRVVGVASPDLALLDETVDVWLAWDLAGTYARFEGAGRDWRFLDVYARLAPGVELEEARAELRAVAAAAERSHPDTNEGWGVQATALAEDLVGHARAGLLILLGAVGFVLAIACADAAGLQLAATSERVRELALRTAVGASPARLTRQLLLESLIVGLGGGALGLALAWGALSALVRLRPEGLPRLAEIGLDLRLGVLSLATAVLAALLSGWLPARRAACRDQAGKLQDGGTRMAGASRAGPRLRRVLVGVQAGLALLLVAGAVLFARSFVRLVSFDRGFDADRVLVMPMRVESDAGTFYRTLIHHLEALPGVKSAAAVTALPMSPVGADFDRPYWREGEPLLPLSARQADIRMATPGYFRTLGLPLLQGRPFDDRDGPDAPRVVAVSRGLARREWPAGDAVGRRLVIDYFGGRHEFEVVAVVGDTRFRDARTAPRPEIYIPHAQNAYLEVNVVVRSVAEPGSLAGAVRRAAAELDPEQAVHSVVTMEQLVRRAAAPERLSALLLLALAGLAATLAAFGTYGLQAALVVRRRAEIGVRMALGAGRGDVVRLVIGEALATTLPGVAAGLLLALALSPLVRGMLFGVGPTDPASLVAGAVAVAALSALAALVPARRAAGVDPGEALRAP